MSNQNIHKDELLQQWEEKLEEAHRNAQGLLSVSYACGCEISNGKFEKECPLATPPVHTEEKELPLKCFMCDASLYRPGGVDGNLCGLCGMVEDNGWTPIVLTDPEYKKVIQSAQLEILERVREIIVTPGDLIDMLDQLEKEIQG